MVSRAKSKCYKQKKVKKLALNSQLPTVKILTNDADFVSFLFYYYCNALPNALPILILNGLYNFHISASNAKF